MLMSEDISTLEPAGPVAARFMASDAFVRGLCGPIGSGKSVTCVMEILRRSQMAPVGADGKRRSRWVAVRNTYSELRTTTIKTWHQWVPETRGRWVSEGPPTHYLNFGDVELEVLFLSIDTPDDMGKLLSLEVTGAWLNEARELPAEVMAVTSRCGRYTKGLGPDQTVGWCGVIMDTNPPDVDHWYYRLAEVDRPDRFEFFKQPGGLTSEAENKAGLRKAGGIEEYYNRASLGKDSRWVDIYVHGNYGFVQDGRPVYPEFNEKVHVRKLAAEKDLPLHIGLDFGLTPCAVIGQRLKDGGWRILSEIVNERTSLPQLAEQVTRHVQERYPGVGVASVTGDPAGVQGQGAGAVVQNVFQILKANGLDARPAPSNDPVLRIEAVQRLLMGLKDGEPQFLIDPGCRIAIGGLCGKYRYRRKRMSGERYEDKPDKSHPISDVQDALQYMVLGAGDGRVTLRGDKRLQPGYNGDRALPKYSKMDDSWMGGV